jgi:hypothetical protein
MEPLRNLTEWQIFCQEKRVEGIGFGEIAKLWQQKK